MKKNSKYEKGITLLEVIVSLIILSFISIIVFINIKQYRNNYNTLHLSDQYYSEKLMVSVGFNQLLRYKDQNKYFDIIYDDNNWKIKDNDLVILEYQDNIFYNELEKEKSKFQYIKDINLYIEDSYLKIEIISEITENIRIRWNNNGD